MEWRNILVAQDEGIGRITLNRPAARNPLDRETAQEILAALEQHFADEQVRCIVISGAGDAFCAGGDLKQMRKLSAMPAQEAYAWGDAIVAAHKRMLTAEKPVIASVHGPAFAGGMGLAAMCDIVIATRSASFAMPEVKIGLFPMIIVAHLARSLPRKVLHEMMLTGNPISAAEGHRLGFVNRLAETREELEAIVTEYGKLFRFTSPSAISLGRRAFALLSDMPASQALDAAQFMNLPFFLGADLQEGTSAFVEHRAPSWATRENPASS